MNREEFEKKIEQEFGASGKEIAAWMMEVATFHPEMTELANVYQGIAYDPTARLQFGNQTLDRDWLMKRFLVRFDPPAIPPDKNYHSCDYEVMYMYYFLMRMSERKITYEEIATMMGRDVETVIKAFQRVKRKIEKLRAEGGLTEEAATLRIKQREDELRVKMEKITGRLSEDNWQKVNELCHSAGLVVFDEVIQGATKRVS